MKKLNLKKLNINKGSFKKLLKHALSPVFLTLLLCSFVLWYTSKLGKEYDTEMSLNIRIDGQKYKVTAQVHGKGSTLVAQRLSLKSKINIQLDELSVRESVDTPNTLIITPASLVKAIDSKTNDIKILQIIEMPEFKIGQEDNSQQQ